MNRVLAWLFFLFPGSFLAADDWSAEDDTFDPKIQSVVIGDASWIGDPSPFVHRSSERTGYTHVHPTNYDGIGPAVQVSLMIPLAPGETEAPGGGMLLLNVMQTEEFIKEAQRIIDSKADKPTKPHSIKTAMKDVDWKIFGIAEKETQFVQLENKTEDNTHQYRFSINACKKLLGAIKHSLEKLTVDSKKSRESSKP